VYAGLLAFVCGGPVQELQCLLRERHQATADFGRHKAVTWDSNCTAAQPCSVMETLKHDAFLCETVV